MKRSASKGRNSREDDSRPAVSSSLAKTQNQRNNDLEQPSRIGSEVDDNRRGTPKGTRLLPKVAANLEELMTPENIQLAKKGLVLLKKKMEKMGSMKENIDDEPLYNTRNSGRQVPTESEIMPPRPEVKRNKPIPEEEPIRKAPQRPSVQSSIDDIPVGNAKFGSNNDIEDQVDASEFIQCTRGCGRKFNPNSIARHEKICEKVFQSKRKAFDSKAARLTQDAVKIEPVKGKNTTSKLPPPEPAASQKKIPKWKLMSAAFRAGLSANKGEGMSKEQKQASEQLQKDMLVLCNYCGRRFSEKAAEKHIAFCQKKAMAMPKMNTTIKKK